MLKVTQSGVDFCQIQLESCGATRGREKKGKRERLKIDLKVSVYFSICSWGTKPHGFLLDVVLQVSCSEPGDHSSAGWRGFKPPCRQASAGAEMSPSETVNLRLYCWRCTLSFHIMEAKRMRNSPWRSITYRIIVSWCGEFCDSGKKWISQAPCYAIWFQCRAKTKGVFWEWNICFSVFMSWILWKARPWRWSLLIEILFALCARV